MSNHDRLVDLLHTVVTMMKATAVAAQDSANFQARDAFNDSADMVCAVLSLTGNLDKDSL